MHRLLVLALAGFSTAVWAGLVLDPVTTNDPANPKSVAMWSPGCKAAGGADLQGLYESPSLAAQACIDTMSAGQMTTACGGTLQMTTKYQRKLTGKVTDYMGMKSVEFNNQAMVMNCADGSYGLGTLYVGAINVSQVGITCPGDPKCPATCTSNQVKSSGYFDIGKTQSADPVIVGCKDGCQVTFDGVSPAGSAMVKGEKHWFAKGSYITTGNTCKDTRPERQIGAGSAEIPKQTCAAGQTPGMVNNVFVCVNPVGADGKSGADQTKDSKPQASSKTEVTTGTNADGSSWVKETTTEVGADGVTKITEKTTTKNAAGQVTGTQVSVVGGTPDNTSKPGGNAEQPPKEQTPCEKNPSDTGCGGSPAGIGELYTKKDKTLSDVLSAAGRKMAGSRLGAAVGGFFMVSVGGACPVVSAPIPFIKTTVTLDSLCTSNASSMLAVMKAVVLVIFSFLSFRIAME